MIMKIDLTSFTLQELVDRFAHIGVEQYDAEVSDNLSRYSRLMQEMRDIDTELRRRGPEARRALRSLFDHPNIQVRLKAANLSLAVEPVAARATLQAISDSKSYPQAADAKMSFLLMADGTFKPD